MLLFKLKKKKKKVLDLKKTNKIRQRKSTHAETAELRGERRPLSDHEEEHLHCFPTVLRAQRLWP